MYCFPENSKDSDSNKRHIPYWYRRKEHQTKSWALVVGDNGIGFLLCGWHNSRCSSLLAWHKQCISLSPFFSFPDTQQWVLSKNQGRNIFKYKLCSCGKWATYDTLVTGRQHSNTSTASTVSKITKKKKKIQEKPLWEIR